MSHAGPTRKQILSRRGAEGTEGKGGVVFMIYREAIYHGMPSAVAKAMADRLTLPLRRPGAYFAGTVDSIHSRSYCPSGAATTRPRVSATLALPLRRAGQAKARTNRTDGTDGGRKRRMAREWDCDRGRTRRDTPARRGASRPTIRRGARRQSGVATRGRCGGMGLGRTGGARPDSPYPELGFLDWSPRGRLRGRSPDGNGLVAGAVAVREVWVSGCRGLP